MGTLRDLCAVGWFDEPEQQRHQQIFPEKRQKLARHFQRVPCTQNGVPEPLVSAGKLVRDDDGQPIAARRYSDHLLLALLKAHRPPRWEGAVCFQLPALRSAADAASAMAALTAGIAAGEMTPGEAAELSKMIEAYIRALEAS